MTDSIEPTAAASSPGLPQASAERTTTAPPTTIASPRARASRSVVLVGAFILFECLVVVADDADEGVDGGADAYEVPENLEPGGGAEAVVEPRPSHEPDADVSGDFEPKGAGREGRLTELSSFEINGVRSLTRRAAFFKRRPRAGTLWSGRGARVLELRQHFPRGRHERLHVLERVRHREEGRLELGGREHEAALEHAVEELGVLGRVGLLGRREVGHFFRREEQREGGADTLDARLGARAADGARQLVLEPAAQALEGDEGALVEALERREAGRDGQGVPGQRARLVHGPERRDDVHDVGPAAINAHRKAAAHDLAEARHV